MDDKGIIDLYFDRSEKAISETAVKYGEPETLLFEENYPASLAQARVHFVLPNDDSNTTDVTWYLSNPIWNQTIPKGGAITGQVAFLQHTGNAQPLQFEGYGQVVSLE